MMKVRRAFSDFDFHCHSNADFGESPSSRVRYEPAYRLGYELAMSAADRDKDWTVVEMFARQAWKEMYPDRPWAEYKEAVRFAWSTVGQLLAAPIY